MSMPRASAAALVAALLLVAAATLAVTAGAESAPASGPAGPAARALLAESGAAGAADTLRRGARAIARERAAERARARRRAEAARRRAAARMAARVASVPGGPDRATLERIAACESGGDPASIGGGGAFRGKYQFDTGTWASVGGSGDPAAAPEAEQDYRAALLYARSGSSPWPVCGR